MGTQGGRKSKLSYFTFLWPLSALIGGSLIGPVNNELPCKDKVGLTMVWTRLTTLFVMTVGLIFAKAYLQFQGKTIKLFQFTDLVTDGATSERDLFWRKAKVIAVLCLGQFICIGWGLGLTWASLNIVQSHAYMLTGLHSPTVLLFYFLSCQRVHKFEKIGTLIVILGVAITMSDPLAVRIGEEFDMQKSLISLLANIPAAIFWIIVGYVSKRLDSVTMLFSQISLSLFYFTIGSVVFEGSGLNLSDEGLLGAFSSKNFLFCMFWSGIWAGFFGFCGYMISARHYSPLVIMNLLLVEPLVSQIFGVALKIDKMPGPLTFMGVGVIIWATNIIHNG